MPLQLSKALPWNLKRDSLTLLVIFLLVLGFPFEHFRYPLFESFSHSLYEKFEALAPFSLHIPVFIEKTLHLYFSDLLILSGAVLLFISKKLQLRDFLTDKHSRFLTFLLLSALLSILLCDCSRYYYLYFSLINLGTALLAFHITSRFFKGKEALIDQLLWILLVVAALECFIGIGQFLTQKSLGLRFLGEHKLYIDRGNVASFPLFDQGRWLFELFSSLPPERQFALRAYGTFPHPNFFAGFLVLTLLTSHYRFALARNKRERIGLFSLIGLQILTLFITFSRAGILGYLLGSSLWFSLIFFKKNHPFHQEKKALTILASFIFAMCMLSMLLLLPHLKARGGYLNYNRFVAASDSERIIAQNTALEVFKAHPLFGIGFNCFTFFPGDFLSNPTLWRDRPHNIYLLLLSETGLFGLGCFLLFFCSLIRPLFIAPTSPIFHTLLAVFIGFLFIGLCDLYFLIHQVGKLMFFLAAGLLAAAGSTQEKIKPKPLSNPLSNPLSKPLPKPVSSQEI